MTAPSSDLAPLGPEERIWRAAVTAAWPICVAFASIVVASEIPFCGFLALTGLPCPFCGGTRAYAALATLDIPTAWRHSPSMVIAVAFAASHTAFLLSEALVGRRLGWHRPWLVGWQAIGGIVAVAWGVRLAGN